MLMPALFTRMSIGPRAGAGLGDRRAGSQVVGQVGPHGVGGAAVGGDLVRHPLRVGELTIDDGDAAPSAAKSRAVARPMPLAAPVTTATRPAIERRLAMLGRHGGRT